MPETPPCELSASEQTSRSGIVLPITARPFEVYAWGAGSTAEFLLLSGIGGMLMPVLTTTFGMNPVLVGWAISIPRIFDALIDPFVGHLSDRTRSRWGRRRPYLFVAAPCAAFFTMAIWWLSPAWSPALQFGYVFATNLFFWIAFAFYTIPLYALGYELEDGYNRRIKVAAVRSIFGALSGFAVYWTYRIALWPVFGSEITGIRWVCVGLGLLVLGFGLLPAICCRERFARQGPSVQTRFATGIRQTLSNRPFAYLMIVRTLVTISSFVFSGLLFYVNIYYVCRGDKTVALSLFGIYGTVSTVCGMVLPPFVSRMGQRYGKRRLLFWGLGLHLATAVAGYLLLTPACRYLLIPLAFLLTPAGTLLGIFTNASLPDICDLDELEHGTRREGLFGAAMSFITKLEISACALVVGYILEFVGFQANAAVQDPAVVERIRLFAFVPYAIASALGLMIAQRFPITQQWLERVQTQLSARRRPGL